MSWSQTCSDRSTRNAPRPDLPRLHPTRGNLGLLVIWEFPKIRGPDYSTLNSRILVIWTPE